MIVTPAVRCDVSGCDGVVEVWSSGGPDGARRHAGDLGWAYALSQDIRDEGGLECDVDLCPRHAAEVADAVLHGLTDLHTFHRDMV